MFGTMNNNNGILEIGGVSVDKLVAKYKTPLYVYDQQYIEDRLEIFKKYFFNEDISTKVIYASKAFLCKAIVQLMKKNDVWVDAVSGGELYLINESGFDVSHVMYHGNNKTEEEVELGVKLGVGYFVIDGINELKYIDKYSKKYDKKVNALLRLNPGIEAHTHEFIQTASISSKFGIHIDDFDSLDEFVNLYESCENISLLGFHCHIGSQISEETAFSRTLDTMFNFVKKFENRYDIAITKVNLGGGFGVKYTNDSEEIDLKRALSLLSNEAVKKNKELNLNIDEIMVEPGRSIINNSCVTLYTVGGIKNTLGDENYILIDGGMNDNIRPALYNANYHMVIANRLNEPIFDKRSIVGKCCESGDFIGKNIGIQKTIKGDILAVFSTGAYNYSMSLNYNKMTRPAVILVKNGKSNEIIRRQTYSDLLLCDNDL